LGAALQADGEYEVRVYGLKHRKEKRSMDHFAGLDVSVKETSVCIFAQMMRVGLYRPVHVKTLRSQKLRMLGSRSSAVRKWSAQCWISLCENIVV
jgi:hypothetical protein